MDRLAPYFAGSVPAWTDSAVLPGGDIPDLDPDKYALGLFERYPALPKALLQRFARTYGTRTEQLLVGVQRTADLGGHFGAGLYAREVDYLVANEWARTADDILFRRTKLGLHVPPDAADRLNAYLGG